MSNQLQPQGFHGVGNLISTKPCHMVSAPGLLFSTEDPLSHTPVLNFARTARCYLTNARLPHPKQFDLHQVYSKHREYTKIYLLVTVLTLPPCFPMTLPWHDSHLKVRRRHTMSAVPQVPLNQPMRAKKIGTFFADLLSLSALHHLPFSI